MKTSAAQPRLIWVPMADDDEVVHFQSESDDAISPRRLALPARPPQERIPPTMTMPVPTIHVGDDSGRPAAAFAGSDGPGPLGPLAARRAASLLAPPMASDDPGASLAVVPGLVNRSRRRGVDLGDVIS